MDRLGVGVLGLGGMGGYHAREVAAHPRARLAGVVDPRPEPRERLAAELGVPGYADLRALLAAGDVDAVAMATPHHLHAPLALACLETGRHVFVEKPIAVRISEADRMVGAAAARGLVLAVGHNYRTFPGNVRLKEIVDGGVLGPLHSVVWQWLESRPESYYGRDPWRSTWAHAGGGVLMNQTSHDLDLLCWIVGRPVEVMAMVGNRAHAHEVEDTAVATVRFACGALASLQLSTVAPRLNYRQLTGDRGTVLCQDEQDANVRVPALFRLGRYDQPLSQLIVRSPELAGQVRVTWEDVVCAPPAEVSQMASFIGACLGECAPLCDGRSASVALELINAIVLSGVRHKAVSLPLDRAEYDALMADLAGGRVRLERAP